MDSSVERLEELLMQRSLELLSAAETRELRMLLNAFPNNDVHAFDRAVAAVAVARLPFTEQMPATLYADIEARGNAMVAARRQTRDDN